MGNKALIMIALLVLAFSSCKKDGGVCISSAGTTASETRQLESFHALEISDNIEVEVYPGYTESRVEITGGKHLLKGIETKVDNGKLILSNNNRCNWLRSFKQHLTVKVYTPGLDQMTYRGAGDVVFKDTLRTAVFTLNSWDASGDLTLLLDCRESYIKLHTGTANVTLYGSSSFLYYYSLSTGFIYGRYINCQNAFLSQSGYGDMYVNPTDHLDAEISKSGDIYYPGKISVNLNRYGSGELLTF